LQGGFAFATFKRKSFLGGKPSDRKSPEEMIMFCYLRKRPGNKRQKSEGKGLGLEKSQGYGGAMRTILFGMKLGLLLGL
jgi:hypothetical protein